MQNDAAVRDGCISGETPMTLLFNRIRQARRGAEMSQAELAIAVGVARSAVAQWERKDGAKPTTDNMGKIAMATAVSFEWLATGRGGRWIGGDEETPAMMLNFYAQCGLEERLLVAFRSLRSPEQQPLVDFVEAMTDRS
jgi:transcriptional regulator with XRE-family HTH domain